MSAAPGTGPDRGARGGGPRIRPRLRGMLADTRPLRVPAFRRLWIASIITMIGAQLTVVSVPAQIYAITLNSAYVGLTGVFGLVPLIVFGLYGGALADAFDRRRLLMITTIGLIISSSGFAVQALLHLNNVWVLLGLFSLQQSFFALNSPARQAILPSLLPGHLLTSANALSTTVMQLGAIAGPLIGGALIPIIGFTWLYTVDAVFLFATLWAVIMLPALLPLTDQPTRPGLLSVVQGLRYLSGHKVLLMSFAVDIVAMVFGMPRALFPQLANVNFGGPTEGGLAFALLYAAIPAGAAVGGIFSGWVSRVRRHGFVIIVAIVCWGVAMAVFGFASGLGHGAAIPWLIVALAALAAGGTADMVSSAFRNTMLLQAADDDVRGRLQGVFIVVVAGGPRVADVVHGGAAAVVGPGFTAGIGGVLVVVLVLVLAFAVPAFVRYRPPTVDPDAT